MYRSSLAAASCLLLLTATHTAHGLADQEGLVENLESDEDYDVLIASVIVMLILVVVFIFHRLPKWMAWLKFLISESGLIAVIGILAGIGLKYSEHFETFVEFDPAFFFEVLLPPIIFYAGYSLQHSHGYIFFTNIGTILTFALVGTLISTVVVSGLCTAVSDPKDDSALSPLTFQECASFGTIISAIDPVATIATFEELNVDNTLFNLVFGESVLNDAVAIVLYRSVIKFNPDEETGEYDDFTFGSFMSAVWEFIYISLGSLGIGVLFGVSITLLFKYADWSHQKELQTLVLIVASFVCYHLAELATLSGIVTILIYGIVMGHYGFWNMEEDSKTVSMAVAQMLGNLAEAFVFALIGLSTTGQSHEWAPGFAVVSFFFCILGRTLNIFPLAWLLNKQRKRPIPWKVQVVMWFSGLRGAIAFALSLEFNSEMDTPGTRVIESTTLLIVLITTILIGGLTRPLLWALGIKSQGEQTEGEQKREVNESKMWFSRMDNRLFKPFLCNSFQLTVKADEQGRPVVSGAELQVLNKSTPNGASKGVGANGSESAYWNDDDSSRSEPQVGAPSPTPITVMRETKTTLPPE